MNTERISNYASHSDHASDFDAASSRRSFRALRSSARVFLTWLAAALLLTGLVATASLAGRPVVAFGGTGSALALVAQLRSAHAAAGFGSAAPRTPGGRTLMPRHMMHSGAIRKSIAAAPTVVPISGAVQTYDVANPPPAFRPLIGYGSAAALNNNSANPPVYINALAATNLTPIWSPDETYLIFSSNRNQAGGLNTDGMGGGSRFHLWAISVNGGEAFQITTSTGLAGGGEFFPSLSGNSSRLAFTSDAQSPGTQNLYVIGFSSAALTAGATAVDVTMPSVISSLTLRYGPGIITGPAVPTEASSSSFTGFANVQRPTFGSSDGQLIVFSALSTAGTYQNHYHLYFLYQSSGGFSNSNSTSYPGKLTDGPADDTDPTFSPDGQFIAFASTATSLGGNTNNSFGPSPPSAVQDPNASQTLTAGPVATRSLFLISGGGSGNGIPFGTAPTSGGLAGGRVTLAGTDDYGPAWSNFANLNQYTNPAPNYAYLAFARASAPGMPHDIDYLQVGQSVSSPNTETLTAESSSNAAIHLNTDDNPAQTSAGGNFYDDIYPSWSPFLSVFSITYSSNRTVTYNDPANSQPTETAVSVAPGGTVTNPQNASAGYNVGAGYAGLLISQVLNLDPPTLLRFSANEVVHVQATDRSAAHNPVAGTPNKLAASGGQPITLTVRLSDREAGIDDTGGPNGGPRVYVQIKDPDSKYQDSQSLEHKVFMKDRRYDSQPQFDANGNPILDGNGNPVFGPQANRHANDVTSGTANGLLDAYDYTLPLSDLYSSLYYNPSNFRQFPSYQRFTYPSYGAATSYFPTVGMDVVNASEPRGTHGGQWAVDAANNPNNTHLFVGKSDPNGSSNPYGTFSFPLTPGPGRVVAPVPGTDPSLFIPHGPEYECQLINPAFGAGGAVDAAPTDYATPYYLAGVDDQGAFSGGTYNGAAGKDRPNTEWLQLSRVPAAQQDNFGGVLYTTTWTTPVSGSDFYVDVIAFDKAAFPNIPGGTYAGQKTNWRIYDNVGGFSTNQSIGNNDVLIVSDYALGQKFAASTFGGRNFNSNLVPKLFGTESYLTDVDINILPDSVYAGIPNAEADAKASAGPPPTAARMAYQFAPVVQPFGVETVESLFSPTGAYPPPTVLAENGLGEQSYLDTIIDDNTVSADGAPNVQSQRYSIWRILSRGPVPQSVLTSYLPKPVQQPVILDPDTSATGGAYANIPAATVLDAPQCVIWLSPYTGDVLADPGTIDDPGNVGQTGVLTPRQSTTSILTSFVQAGGRLCVTGQDVGSTLTLNGTVNNTAGAAGNPNFLPDVLNATLVATGSGSNVLAGTNNRITGSPFYDNTYVNASTGLSSFTLGSNVRDVPFLTLNGPIQGNYTLNTPNYPYQDNLVLGDADYGDSALSQMPAVVLPIGSTPTTGSNVQGQPDVIAATNGAQVAMTYVGGVGGTAMVFHDDPYLGGTAGVLPTGAVKGQLPNGGTGSRVVYAGFGLEGLSNDYYSSASPNPNATISDPPNPLPYNEIIPVVIPRNPRPAILHNIVSYLRTGRVSGTITQTAGTGQGAGTGIDGVTVYLRPTGAAPTARAAFSALTASGGRFTIAGVEAGTYTLVAIKPGFQRAATNSGVTFTVEGDVTKTGATLTMTPLPPANIAGVVQDTNKVPINGATVTFTSQDNSITRTITTVNGSVTTNPADNYFLQSVPVTTYTATATGPLNSQGLPEYTAATAPDAPNNAGVTTTPNTTKDSVNFTLTAAPASISGAVVVFPNGPGIVGATVTLTDGNNKVVGTTTSGTGGAYSFTGIAAATAAATFTVSATAPSYAPGSVTTPLQAGSVIPGPNAPPLNVPLAGIPSGNITGTVTDQRTGLPLGGATVTFTLANSPTQTATTAADGTYTLTAIPTGTYSGVGTGPATGQAYQPSPAQSVPVANQATATANFALVPILASLRGTVTDATTKQPLPGVTITVTDGSGNAITTNPAVLTTDGSGNYTATLPPGTYFLTASKASYDSQTSAATAFALGATVTVPFSLTSSIGTLGGLVTDQNGAGLVGGATITVIPAGQTTGLTFTTSASGTPGPDGSPINYTGQLTKGTYTVTVTKGPRTSAAKTVTIVGGAFNRVDFSAATGLPALHTFPAGIQFVSTPYDYSALGFSGLFGALNTAPSGTTPNGNRSNVAVWNPLASAYALDPNPPADTLRLGVGYWVYLKTAVPVTQQGAAPPAGGFVAVPLGKGWNQIGVPSPSATGIPIASLKFDNGTGGMITFAQAAGSQYNLVTNPLYSYAGGGYQSLGSTGVLTPWTGYWIYVNAPATLEIPIPAQ